MKLYAEISKTEEMDDGTIKVWGYASSESVDSDGETITADAMKAALPDYMKFGAVREMHQAKAAGTAIEANVEDDGRTFFGAHVVDTEAVKKVKANVYKGFSIGGKVTERDTLDKNVIKGLKLVEVSLVDRPANPDATFTMYKADDEDKAPSNVKKGMHAVARFASLINDINYLQQDTAWEADYEADGSNLPAKIKAWMGEGLELLKAMLAEESDELLAAKLEKAEKIEKTAEIESISKLSLELDLIKSQLDELKSERDRVEKRVKELEALPASPKGALKAIAKENDVEITKSEEPIYATPEDKALAEIRKMYAR